MDTIIICMGSSCFSRGNTEIANSIKNFIKNHKLEVSVCIKGCLCQGKCKKGPNIIINNKMFSQISLGSIEKILIQELNINDK